MLMRIVIASIVSSLFVLPLYLVILALSGDLNNALLAPMLLAAWMVSAATILFIALPLHFILKVYGKSYAALYVVPGFSLAAALTYMVEPFGQDGNYWLLWQCLAMGFLGASVAGVFWSIASNEPAT